MNTTIELETNMTDWHAEYVKAAALESAEAAGDAAVGQQAHKTQADGALAFLDLFLAEEGGEWWAKLRRKAQRAAKNDGQKGNLLDGEDKKQLKTRKKRLAAVGKSLVLPLPELNASVNSKEAPRSAKVRVLQLQLVCRLLRYAELHKKERKLLKKEIRGLLDRVALLLDAANPPSLADEDADERSPFQEFLLHQLAPRLELLMPQLMRYLLRTYELEEDEAKDDEDGKDALNMLLPALQPMVKPPLPPSELPTSAATGKGSILSALRQERPAKRVRPEASELFEEVTLPQSLQQKQSRPRKSRRVSKSHNSGASKSSSVKTSQDSLLRAAAGAKPMHAPRTLDFSGKSAGARLPGETDLLRRAANPSAAKKPAAPLLQRAMSERSHFYGRQTPTGSSPSSAVQGASAATASKNQSPAAPGSALRRAVTSSSVVMRTPDRPKRMAARTTRRVLVEASPPLRKPTGAAVPRLLQPKSRPGSNPPSLFR